MVASIKTPRKRYPLPVLLFSLNCRCFSINLILCGGWWKKHSGWHFIVQSNFRGNTLKSNQWCFWDETLDESEPVTAVAFLFLKAAQASRKKRHARFWETAALQLIKKQWTSSKHAEEENTTKASKRNYWQLERAKIMLHCWSLLLLWKSSRLKWHADSWGRVCFSLLLSSINITNDWDRSRVVLLGWFLL